MFLRKFNVAGVFFALALVCAVSFSCKQSEEAVSVEPVKFSLKDGSYDPGTVVKMTSATEGAEIWYCPSTKSNLFYPTNYKTNGTKGNTFTLTEPGELKLYAVAVDAQGNVSSRTVGKYTVNNLNKNANNIEDSDYAGLLCTAKIDENNKFVAHSIEFNGEDTLTYCLEYKKSAKHSTWVGFYFDSELIKSGSGVSRYDTIVEDKDEAFCADPLIPASEGGIVPYDHKSDGYDRGHLCASQDRFYNQEANAQTFYLTNMSPQLHEFNANFWGRLETETRTLSKNAINAGFQNVYVIKGGDLNHLLKNYTALTAAEGDGQIPTTTANGYSKKGVAVPAYYYTVLLAVSDDGDYKMLGFYIPHVKEAMSDEEIVKYSGISLTSKPSNDTLKKFVYSIDEIEEKTGLDFFCNLIDSVEDELEAKSADECISAWAW